MSSPIILGAPVGQNWMITPAALAVGEEPPANIYEQKWLLVLSGVVEANFQGNSTSQWRSETVTIAPDMAGGGLGPSGPVWWAIQNYSIPIPSPRPPNNHVYSAFSLTSWAPFASLSSIYDADQSTDAGYAVNLWRPTHFGTVTDAVTQQPVNNIFAGIDVDLAVRDTDAQIYRLGYNITLLGRIVFGEETL
jgi:hypothetical protein